MSRLLFFAVIISVVYWLLKSYNRQVHKDCDAPDSAQDMVRCAHCGVYVPRPESFAADGKFYCGEAHHRAHTGGTE